MTGYTKRNKPKIKKYKVKKERCGSVVMNRQCQKEIGHEIVDDIHEYMERRKMPDGQKRVVVLYWQGRDVWSVPVVEDVLPFGTDIEEG